MLSVLHIFAEEVNTRAHLTSLLNDIRLSVLIEIDGEGLVLAIDSGRLEIQEVLDQEIDVFMTVKEPVMKELLLGKMKLRMAQKYNQLKLKSTIRNSLLLESLFFLAMSGSNIKESETSKLLVD